MKKGFLLLPILGVFTYLTLTSSSGGRSGNYTGSPSASRGCGSCHGNSATSGITVTFELDSAGIPKTSYKAGKVYTLKMIGTNTTTNSLPYFGYQMVAVMGVAGTSQAGTWGTLPTGTSAHSSSSGLQVLGHNMRISPSSGSGSTGTVYTVSVPWTAPVAGSGTVSVYAVCNAVNGNGSDGSGDYWNTNSASFTELPTVSAVGEVANNFDVKAFPNPVATSLTLELGNGKGTYNISVFDLSGKIVATATTGDAKVVINTSDWATGLYQVAITNNSTTQTIAVVKQ